VSQNGFREACGEGGVCMQFWTAFFSIVAAIALVVQVAILIGLFLQLKRTTESINKMVSDLHTRMGPILTRTQILLDDTQPKISTLVEDASHIVYLARGQAQPVHTGVGPFHSVRHRNRGIAACAQPRCRYARRPAVSAMGGGDREKAEGG